MGVYEINYLLSTSTASRLNFTVLFTTGGDTFDHMYISTAVRSPDVVFYTSYRHLVRAFIVCADIRWFVI